MNTREQKVSPSRQSRSARSDAPACVRRFLGAEGGTAIVEFALVLPPLMILLLGIMEIGRGFWTQSALNYAVEQAARCAAVDKTTCGTAGKTQNYAAAQSGANFNAAIFTATTDTCGSLVTASYPLTLAIPYVATSFSLTARSCFPK